MKKIDFLRIAMVLACITGFLARTDAQKMPDTANDLYKKFVVAIETANLNDLELVMCKATMVRMKNEALSMGMEYPKDFFEGMKMALLDFKNFRYLNSKTNGPTTNAYYMYGENNSEANIVTICMVEENGKLMIEQFKMRDAKDFIMNLHKKDYSFLETKEFQPSGTKTEAPLAVEKVDYVSNIDVVCYGYKVSVTVNGFFQEEVKNTGRSGVLIGGVKKGENVVEISVERIDPNEKELPTVLIRSLINNEEKEVFYMNEEVNGKITKTFTVN